VTNIVLFDVTQLSHNCHKFVGTIVTQLSHNCHKFVGIVTNFAGIPSLVDRGIAGWLAALVARLVGRLACPIGRLACPLGVDWMVD
jgi:hypothetical protein